MPMFQAPVLKAKFMFPELPPGVLYCDRLRNLDITGSRAVILTAPAGYGKTTAVQLALQPFRGSIHWYRLEKEDLSLPVFFSSLIESLFGGADQNTDSHKSLGSIGNIPEEYSLLAAVVCQDAWSLYAQGSLPRFLVFDDFQHVADNAAICEIINYLISNMPPNLHVIVVSRVETGILAEKLTLSGQLVCLDETSLIFTRAEIEALFSGSGAATADLKNYADDVYTYTEGWIAGVALMKHTREYRETTGGETLKGDRQGIFRYLLGEVFTGADREMIRQAALVSLLDEFISEDLSSIFHIESPEETVSWLERNNLYIQKTNTDPPSYRFHSLFRDALRQALAGEYTPSEVETFHLAAADHFEGTKRYAAAVRHYLAGSDEQNAVRVASHRGFEYMDNGDMEAAAELIRAMPEQMIFGNATLLIILGCSLCSVETERGFSYLIKAMEMAVKNKEYAAAVKVQGFAISVCIQQNDFAGIKDVIKIVPMPKAIRGNRQVWKMLLHSLFLKSATSYQVRQAKALSRVIDKLRMKDQADLWQYSSILSNAYLRCVTGDFDHAEDLIRGLTEHTVALRNDRWLAFGLQLSGFLSVCMGKTDALMSYADKLSSLGLKYADSFTSSYGAHYTAQAKYQNRDFAGAEAAAIAAEKYFVENRNTSMAILAGILQAAWQAEQDPGGRYASRIEERLISMAAAGGSEGFVMVVKAVSGALYLREGNPGKAEELLVQAWNWAKRKQALQTMCGAAMHLWALYRETGDKRLEAEYLRFFGETSAKKGYLYFREMTFASLVGICARCVQEGIALRHMAAIIGKYFGFEAAGLLLKEPSAVVADPDGFIRQFPIQAGSGPKSIGIKLFGAFQLTADGKAIDPDLFKTRKISGILKCVLASPGKTVSREKLAAAFWPDSDGKAAQNSLRVALFELRKAMAALDMPFDSGKALIAEDGGGLYVCRPEIVESDVSRFTALLERLRAGFLPQGEEIAALKGMTALYAGDFLEGVDTEDSAVERAYYMAAYVEASYKLAEHYIRKGDMELAEELMLKHLKIDPSDEKLCGILADLYQKTGRARQAASLKRQFTQRFEKEMGVKPEF